MRATRRRPTMTAAELDALGTSTTVEIAGRALGLSRDHAYDLAKAGQFPVPVIRVGARYVVPTRPLREALGMT